MPPLGCSALHGAAGTPPVPAHERQARQTGEWRRKPPSPHPKPPAQLYANNICTIILMDYMLWFHATSVMCL
eukprot:2007205-Pleurochrysis_carterae.AAC.1